MLVLCSQHKVLENILCSFKVKIEHDDQIEHLTGRSEQRRKSGVVRYRGKEILKSVNSIKWKETIEYERIL